MAVLMIPGAHCIDADVLRGVIQSCRFSQADHAVFRRGVSRLAFEAFHSGAGRSIDDRAAPLLEHQQDFVLHA